MNNSNMSFGGYVWKNNPTKLTVTYKNSISERVLPYMGTAADLIGRKRRVIKGSGSFCGENFQAEFNELERIFKGNTPKILIVPGIEPIKAMFTSLEYIGVNSENILAYSFEFTQWDNDDVSYGKKNVRAIGGESLWNYVGESSIESLVEKNPHIPYINVLEKGEIINL